MRNWIRNQILKFGWDVRRVSSYQKEKEEQYVIREREKWAFIESMQPKTILDIGANIGQFATLIRSVCPTARIISFEPLKDCYQTLKGLSCQLNPHDVIHSALGTENTISVINKNEYSPSSSILEMKQLHY